MDPPPTSPSEPERVVLVVDPESAVRGVIGRILRATCRVEEAATGAEVLAALQGGRRFSVILCEVELPDADGIDLVDRIAVLDADQAGRVILLTSWAPGWDLKGFALREPLRVLEKPFDATALRAAVKLVAEAVHPTPTRPWPDGDRPLVERRRYQPG